MALKMIVDSLEEVPEGARGEYEERDGKFQLQVVGAFSQIDRDKLHESLRKERELHTGAKTQLSTFGEHTPETISSLEADRDRLNIEVTALKKEGGPTGADLDQLVESRVLARIAPLERDNKRLRTTLGEVTGERDDLTKARAKDTILRDVLGAFTVKELGSNPDARPDVELWATSVFELDAGGNVVSRDGVGLTPGLKPSDIFKDMKDQGARRHWFGPTVGAGARDGNLSGIGGENPFTLNEKTGRPASFTKAAAMCKADPARAKRLCSAAKANEFFPSLYKD